MSLLLQHTCTAPTSASSLAGQPVSLGVFLLIGLFGGAHCLGMCGPLVTTYADRMREQADEVAVAAPTDSPLGWSNNTGCLISAGRSATR